MNNTALNADYQAVSNLHCKLVSVNWTMNLRLISLSRREVRDRLTTAKVFLCVRDLGQ